MEAGSRGGDQLPSVPTFGARCRETRQGYCTPLSDSARPGCPAAVGGPQTALADLRHVQRPCASVAVLNPIPEVGSAASLPALSLSHSLESV